MNPSPFNLIDTAALKNFVLARGKKEGGFSATPSLPPTLQDTFYAIDILAAITPATLPVLARPEAVDAFLRAWLRRDNRLPWRLIWFIHQTCLSLDLPRPGLIPIAEPTTAEEFYYRHRLSPPKQWPLNDKYPRRTCRDIYFDLLLRRREMSRDENNRLASWFIRCRNHDGGFGFFPGTTSYIENCHFCLAGLALLRKHPGEIKKTKNFIIFSQTACGGFSRNIRAAPFLDASWHAIKALDATTP